MIPEQNSPSDEELARLSQGGSLSAFEELVDRYEGRVFRFVARLCPDERDVREVTQDAFVSAYQAISRFDASRSFAAWLFTIARRKSIDRLRCQTAAPDSLPDLAELDDPARQLERRETLDDLWTLARACLPGLQFQALWLKYAEEMSVAEIARVLRRSRVHVKVLLFRGRAALARKLNERQPKAAFPRSPAGFRGPLFPKGVA